MHLHSLAHKFTFNSEAMCRELQNPAFHAHRLVGLTEEDFAALSPQEMYAKLGVPLDCPEMTERELMATVIGTFLLATLKGSAARMLARLNEVEMAIAPRMAGYNGPRWIKEFAELQALL